MFSTNEYSKQTVIITIIVIISAVSLDGNLKRITK